MAKAVAKRRETAAERRARFVGVTPERLAQARRNGERVELVNFHPDELPHYQTVRFAGGEIVRLARRGKLEPHLVAAAERLAALHHACRWPDARAINPARIRVDGGGDGDLPERVLAARDAWFAALEAMGNMVRPVVVGVVVEGRTLQDVGRMRLLARNRRDRALAALWVLKSGLDVLARHFGIAGPAVVYPQPENGW